MSKSSCLGNLREHLLSHPAAAARFLDDALLKKDVVALAKACGATQGKAAYAGLPQRILVSTLAPTLSQFLFASETDASQLLHETDMVTIWEELDVWRRASSKKSSRSTRGPRMISKSAISDALCFNIAFDAKPQRRLCLCDKRHMLWQRAVGICSIRNRLAVRYVGLR